MQWTEEGGCRVSSFDPVWRPSSPKDAIPVLRHDALKAELAGVFEHGTANIALHARIEQDAVALDCHA